MSDVEIGSKLIRWKMKSEGESIDYNPTASELSRARDFSVVYYFFN